MTFGQRTGNARFRRLIYSAFTVFGFVVLTIVVAGLLTDAARPGMRFEAWLQFGVAAALLTCGVVGLTKGRR